MENLTDRRSRLMGPNVPTFFETPVHIVRGQGVWLWDADGKRYLDCYNNVPHVGHCHPAVTEAIARQAAVLNTHTRYLHEGVLDLLDRITATMGHGLSQGILVCTGSEANDIALRMAQAVTGATGIVATDNTYHGNTTATAQLSTRRPPIGGYPPHVRLVPAPESDTDPEVFGAAVAQAIAGLQQAGHGFSGMMLCPIFANEGLPNVAPGFFAPAEQAIRRAGGLVLCDEVQPGFGRTGRWWGHDWLGVTPDVVTLGKPMGNGHPVAGVIATPDVMAAFRTAFGYFNTFGGNPVSAAAALAVLDVIESEDLIPHAAAMGSHGINRLNGLSHPAITEIRGNGLFFGAVLEQGGKPATDLAIRVVEEMKEAGVLIGRAGRQMNILKMRPPMPISADQIDLAIDTLADVLSRHG
ncbi:aspartate aminotransferase family protein [Oceaniovalibus sp. ACAM 378]|uniref:aspartate aminotransferase family protein n=1 Tax=Oceaniovalibus sp. ACAM 378 TaxID=2599923 RepID=UPI0011D48469|nr:aspartate aminotransferase family protein [Oceaniovalibus sp. ACAM 378]TYB90561.1 aspartate aminotransferase family protein [Oceaniovalibus sp. ACAM 378]